MIPFIDRSDAGRQLAKLLKKYNGIDGVVLAVPRGGVPVAYEVAIALDLPLDIVLVKKLGHPSNPEYAIGAVGLTESFVVPHEDVSDFYLFTETRRVRKRLQEMKEKFMAGKLDLKQKTVIIVDDGIATGNTALSTIRLLKKEEPSKMIVAVPVISESAYRLITGEVDEVIAVIRPETFYGVGRFYEDFNQLTDEEVADYLQKLSQLRKAG